MTAEFTQAVNEYRDAADCGTSPWDERMSRLLQGMLQRVRSFQATPLQFEMDSVNIVNATLKDVLGGIPADQLALLQDWDAVKALFDTRVQQALSGLDEEGLRLAGGSPPSAPRDRPTAGAAENVSRNDESTSHPLAVWLERFHTAICTVDPCGIEIVELGLEGYTSREIAQRLGLGFRLMKRIIRDMRFAIDR